MLRLWHVLLLLPVFFLMPQSLFAQWEEIPGFQRREVLKVDSFHHRIFMLEDRGILYRSDNHGMSWKILKPGGLAEAKVESFAGTGNTLVIYSGTGIWRSDDLGDSWTFVLPATASSPPYMASVEAVGGQFFVSRQSGIMRLDLAAQKLVVLYNISASHVKLYRSGNELWATASQNFVHMSPDLGKTWVKYNNFFTTNLAFQGDTVWGVLYQNPAPKAIFVLKSDPTQTVQQLAVPALSNSTLSGIAVADGQLYLSFWSGVFRLNAPNANWTPVIPYWKELRIGKVWSDGTYLFCATSYGLTRQNPDTGTWSLLNTGVMAFQPPYLKHFGPYLFSESDVLTDFDGVLQPGPAPVWITAHRLETSTIGHTDSGFYAWDDSSRLWHSADNLWEWTYAGKGPTLLAGYRFGRVFGRGDTLYSFTSERRILQSINRGADWKYCSNIGGNEYTEKRLYFADSTLYYLDTYNRLYMLNTKTGQVAQQNTVPGWDGLSFLQMDVHNSNLYVRTTPGIMQSSANQGLDWQSWDVLGPDGIKIGFSDHEVCEAGIFVIGPYKGLFYAAEPGDTFTRISFPPFDTLADPTSNSLVNIEYVDGYLYVSQYDGQMYRQKLQPLVVHAYSGRLFHDDNDNGKWDAAEKPIPNILVRRGKYRYAVTNAQGRYTILDDLAPDSIRIAKPWRNWRIKPKFWYGNTPGDTFDFGYQPPFYRDFSVEMALYPPLKPGFPSFLQLHWENHSKKNDATIRWALPSGYMSIIEAQTKPDSIHGDTLIWHLPPQPPGYEGDIYVAVQTHPNVPIGTPVPFWSDIAPILTDDVPEDNVDTATTFVVAAFDPNDKQVEPKTYTTADLAAGRPLQYTVRFQNTGNAPASFVYIRDTLAEGLDLSTMRVLMASHPYSWRIIGPRVVEFLFNPIDLPDSTRNEAASHGFIRYAIAPEPDAQVGDTLRNTAYIYFDYNAPVQTNTVQSVIEAPPPVSTQTVYAEVLRLRPNPTTGMVRVYAFGKASEILVFNALGEMQLRMIPPAGSDSSELLDLGVLPAGVYWIQVRLQDGRIATGKVVRS